MGATASTLAGGWPDNVVGPTDEPFNDLFPTPKALTREAIQEIVGAFVKSAQRALKAGVDVIEIHNAHGYLLHRSVYPVWYGVEF